MRGAIEGMMSSLGDPHTTYMNPEQFRRASAPLEGEYEGIGAYVDITGEYLKIISPMPDSPAEKAGLKPNDTIVAVNGEDMTGEDGNLVLKRILGPAGTEVTLTIQREGETETFDVTITRAKIIMPSAEGEMLEDGIAYVRIYTYGDKTMTELRAALKELMAQKPSGLIVDLRNNGGGYLHTAIDVTSQFVKGDQIVMYEEFGDGSREEFKSKSGGLATNIPIVVLVNGGSASAAEITAGALQDLGRAELVGTTTFGKGSVQRWSPLSNEEGAVRITIARWYTPDDRQIHEIGIEPDHVVELTEEDVEAELDPQLDKAVELLKNK
jgi:carboxyl-terminal processing protease